MKRLVFIQIACFAVVSALVSMSAVGEEGSAKPRLGPGALITIPPSVDYDATYNRADMVEVLKALPKPDAELADDVRFDPEVWAKDVRYTRDIWCLQFSFKPIRVISVDIPNKEGSFDKKEVWYLVYNVKNIGPSDFESTAKERTIKTDDGDRTVESVEYSMKNPGGSIGTGIEKDYQMPIAQDTTAVPEVEPKTPVKQTRDTPLTLRELPGTFGPRPAEDEPIEFVPQFILATDHLVLDSTSENNPNSGRLEIKTEIEKISYIDQIIPIALGPIMKREGMTAIPETTVSIARKPFKSGEDRWGVAMWTDIDPRITRFSIYVSGLTNAYRWMDSENASGKVGEGRKMEQKVLKTNWWRKGDRFTIENDQFQYGQPGTLDYEWIFR